MDIDEPEIGNKINLRLQVTLATYLRGHVPVKFGFSKTKTNTYSLKIVKVNNKGISPSCLQVCSPQILNQDIQ